MSHTRLNASVTEVLGRLPRMGRVMVAGSGAGVTHERIAAVEAVAEEAPGIVRLQRAGGESVVVAARVATILVNRENKMRDKYYPSLSFRDAQGVALFGITGFEGLEPFDAALEGLQQEPAEAPEAAPPASPAAAPSEGRRVDDALALAQKADCEVGIMFSAGGLVQFWNGRVGEVKPAMGFLNIIQSDFHLHVKEGAIAYWQDVPLPDFMQTKAPQFAADNRILAAFAADGAKTPLLMRVPATLLETSGPAA